MRSALNWIVMLGSPVVLFVTVEWQGRGEIPAPRDVTIIEIDETGRAHTLRSAAELQILLERAPPDSNDGEGVAVAGRAAAQLPAGRDFVR